MNKREVLNKQVFAQPSITIKKLPIHFFIDQVSQIIRNFKDTYTKIFTTIIGKIVSYLGDKKTEGILIKVIKVNLNPLVPLFLLVYRIISLKRTKNSMKQYQTITKSVL